MLLRAHFLLSLFSVSDPADAPARAEFKLGIFPPASRRHCATHADADTHKPNP